MLNIHPAKMNFDKSINLKLILINDFEFESTFL